MSGVGSTEPLQRAEVPALPAPERGSTGVGSTEPLQRAEVPALPAPERE
jgi:hypothetical protein